MTKYPPLTVHEAVNYLYANMSFNDERILTDTSKENIDDLFYSLGAYARSILGLWSGNDDLLESCRVMSGEKDMDADLASMFIIGLLWELLHKNANPPATD